jgi:hypothetical protein
MTWRVRPPRVEPFVSIGSVELAFQLPGVVAQQLQHRVDALTALGAAATGRIDLARTLAARGRGCLPQLLVGQRIAQAYIHDLTVHYAACGLSTRTANASQ